jgi:hypothetical protein
VDRLEQRRVHIKPEDRGDGGDHKMAEAVALGLPPGVSFSLVGFDSNNRKLGKLGPSGYDYAVPSSAEMVAYVIERKTHRPSGHDPFIGRCVNFDMTAWEDYTNGIMILLILSNGNRLTSAALADLAAWGLWNDGSTPARSMNSTDKLAAVCMYGMEQGTCHEIRSTADEIYSSCLISDRIISG